MLSSVYDRTSDVVTHTLSRANGVCEKCLKPAPFKRSSDATPYLEVHHMITLSDGVDGTIEYTIAYTIALCPNCHLELHLAV